MFAGAEEGGDAWTQHDEVDGLLVMMHGFSNNSYWPSCSLLISIAPGRRISGDKCPEHTGHNALSLAGAGPGQHPVAGGPRVPGSGIGGSAIFHCGGAIAGPYSCVLLRPACCNASGCDSLC